MLEEKEVMKVNRVSLNLDHVQSISYDPDSNNTIIRYKVDKNAELYNEIRVPSSYVLTFGDMEDEGILFIEM